MSDKIEPDAVNLAAMAWSAYRGHKVYEATGDARKAVGMGFASYGGYYVIVGGLGWTMLGIMLGIFWAPFLLILLVSIPAIFGGIHMTQQTTQRYRTTIQQAYTVPPPAPGEELTTGEYVYGYDVNTGRFTRTRQQARRRQPSLGH